MSITTEQIWEEMSQKLRQFFRHRLPDAHLAEDLLQETFVRIHNGLPSLQETERLVGWVYRIAHRTLVDHLRKSRSTSVSFPVEALPPEDITPEDATPDNYNEVVSGWLPSMVQHLPATYREAVELAELRGLTQREVSEHLGVSLSGAKSRVQRGREKLKTFLLDCCQLEMDRRGNVVDYQCPSTCETGCTSATTPASCNDRASLAHGQPVFLHASFCGVAPSS